MTRTYRSSSIRRLAVVTAAFALVFAGFSATADAGRKKRKRVTAPSKTQAKALKELMGAFKFGMSKEKVIKVVEKQVKERYAEQISNTNDVYQQDKLRREGTREVKRFKKSELAFKGQRTGWDVSLIDDQFAHKSGESMMVYWETHQGRNQRRFFFFHEGELYKMFIALDTSSIPGEQRNFDFFKGLMQKRFGAGQATNAGITWKLKNFRVDALDKLRFYNSFCLVVTHPGRAKAVAAARPKVAGKKHNNIIDSIKDDGTDGPDLNEGSNTIDGVLKQ